MRLWSIHPGYLDARGLTALWREALLAQKVLTGETTGYRNHPQLIRFRRTDDPLLTIGAYLRIIANEADRRGYRFNGNLILFSGRGGPIPVTDGQIRYEFSHLLKKLEKRNPALFFRLKDLADIKANPLFTEVPGGIEEWERDG